MCTNDEDCNTLDSSNGEPRCDYEEESYTSEAEYNFFLEQWEAMRSRSEIIQGPPIIPITYANNEMLGLTTDCRNLTKATCGIAIKGDEMSLIADLILEIGITRAPRVAGAIQRKQQHLLAWVDAYQMHQKKANQENNVKRALRDRLNDAWDSWPGKVWRMTVEGVELVRENIALSRVDRCTEILRGFWNTFRRRTRELRVKQESPEERDTVNNPAFFTGDLPQNSIVGLNCANRPDQVPFTNVIIGSKVTHDDDQTVMPCKCPTAFEWKLNIGWDAEARLQQRIHIEESKDPRMWQGPLAKNLEDLKKALEGNWSPNGRSVIVIKCLDHYRLHLSEKEYLLFQWMCIHVTLGGTPTSNPKSGIVFDYIHLALNYNSEFVLDIIQGR